MFRDIEHVLSWYQVEPYLILETKVLRNPDSAILAVMQIIRVMNAVQLDLIIRCASSTQMVANPKCVATVSAALPDLWQILTTSPLRPTSRCIGDSACSWHRRMCILFIQVAMSFVSPSSSYCVHIWHMMCTFRFHIHFGYMLR